MKSPAHLPWWVPLPTPVLIGVVATWMPLSVPAMAGLAVGATAYMGLNMLFDREADGEKA